MKPWNNTFEVIEAYKSHDALRISYVVVYKGTTDRVNNNRYYSNRKDAERGAAQIYNAIEKAILG